MEIITTASQDYINIFTQYLNQFLSWGQWLFFSLLTINLVISCFWYAFDSESFHGSAAKFIRNFFIITVFYTIMVNHVWLIQIIETALAMGKTVTGMTNIDPSSIIENGFAIANNLMHPVMSFNPFKIGAGAIIILVSYLIVIGCFISVALNLAVTLIMCQLWVTVGTFFLGFSALDATRQIAKTVLESLLALCVKLLGLYLVIGAGTSVISKIEAQIPGLMSQNNFDAYWWLVSAVLLFWLLSKNIPDQMSRLVSSAISETRGHESAAIAFAAMEYSKMAAAASTNIIDVSGKLKGAAGDAMNRMAGSHDMKTQGMGISAPAGKTSTGSSDESNKSTSGSLSDTFRKMNDSARNKQSTGVNSTKTETNQSDS